MEEPEGRAGITSQAASKPHVIGGAQAEERVMSSGRELLKSTWRIACCPRFFAVHLNPPK